MSWMNSIFFIPMAIWARNVTLLFIFAISILSHLKFHLIITKKLVGNIAIIFDNTWFFGIWLFRIIKCSRNSVSHLLRAVRIRYKNLFIRELIWLSVTAMLFFLYLLNLFEFLVNFLLIYVAKCVNRLIGFRVLGLELSQLRKFRGLWLLLGHLFLFFGLLLWFGAGDDLAIRGYELIWLSWVWLNTGLIGVDSPLWIAFANHSATGWKPLVLDTNSSLFFYLV